MVAQTEGAVFSILRNALANRGALIDGVAIREHEDDIRSLVAIRNLAPNHIILRIPSTEVITEKRARECGVVGDIMQAVKASSLSERLPDVDGADAAITLFILHEMARGDSSPLAPWLATLPSSFETPLTVEEDEIYEHLSGSPLLHFALRLREELREMFDEWLIPFACDAHPEEFPRELCTFERFIYVHSVYDSRAFRIDDDTCLVPFADMANHQVVGTSEVNIRVRGWKVVDNNATTSEEVDADLGVELYVSSPNVITAGTELNISYGSFPNAQLLLHYGFALDDNPVDSLPITLSVPDSDPVQVHTKKLILLHLDKTGLLSLEHDLTAQEPMPLALLATARLMVMEEDELKPITMHNMNFTDRVSDLNEIAARHLLLQIFQCQLDEYPTDGDLQSNKVNVSRFHQYCAIYIANIKQNIIRNAIQAITNLP